MKRSFLGFCVVWLGCASAGAEAFFTLSGFNGFYGSGGVPPGAFDRLGESQRAHSAELKCVAFTPAGDWVILFGGNGVWTSNTDLPAVKRLTEMGKDPNADVRCVAFSPGGAWTILGPHCFWGEGGLPENAFKKITEVNKHGGTLRSIAYAPDGGWVLLFDQCGVYYEGIPHELQKVLNDAVKNRVTVQCVAFTTFGDWICLTDNGWRTSNLNLAASKFISGAEEHGAAPKWVAFVPEADNGKGPYRLVTKPTQHVVATLTTDGAHPDAEVDEWVLYAPQVPNLPNQRDVKTTFEPAGKVVHEESPLKRPFILTRIADGRKEVHTVLKIEATLMSRRLVRLAPGETAPVVKELAPEEVKNYTRASPWIDFNSKGFQDWMNGAGLKRKEGETDMVFARRGFAYIKHHFTYAWPTPNRTPTQTCKGGSSDCWGLSALYVGLLRANGVPARLLGGRWAVSQPDLKDIKTHCKAEFFAPGVGWVPVETSGAVGDVTGSDFACFGNDGGDFITFMNAEDALVDTFYHGKVTICIFQGLGYWWHGSGPDKNSRWQEMWKVEKR